VNALIVNAKSTSSLAIIRSLGRKGIDLTCASDTKTDFPLYSKYCREKIILSTSDEDIEKRIDEILAIVKNKHFDVFIPVMSEHALFNLAKHKIDFEKYTKLLLPSSEQLSILNNKAKVNVLLKKLGLPCPKTFFADSNSELESILQDAVFPVVIKPYHGEGALGIKVITDPKDMVSSYNDIHKMYGPTMIQEFIHGVKHTAVFLLNKDSEVRRFFIHRAIRENPVSGGPTCFLKSVRYDDIFDPALELLRAVHFTGLASMEFIIDKKDMKPKIIDVKPRFYGPLQCAISAGVDLPFAVFNMALNGDIETDLSYREEVTCRHLLFEDTKHMISILKGYKSPKYPYGKIRTILNYLNFFHDDSYFVLSLSDPVPGLKKIFGHI
jgi:predicted ATP-grasp superfamily ATP-dependent carboligase